METSILAPMQKYAAAGLFALALHHSQIHQTRPYLSVDERQEHTTPGDSGGAGDSELWIHENSGLLWPVLRFLEVDNEAWHGIQETAKSSEQVKHHIRALLMSLSEESNVTSSERKDKELSLAKAVDAMELTLETASHSHDDTSKRHEYELKCHERFSTANAQADSQLKTEGLSTEISPADDAPSGSMGKGSDKPMEEQKLLSCQRKVTVLYELLSACLSRSTEGNDNCSSSGKTYDARHRMAFRFLTTWFGIQWNKMEAVEILVASSLIASMTKENEGGEIAETPWDNWKRGGIIGAAALTGGTLLAVTGGLAAPALAQGFSALGLSAAAGAAGSTAGSAAFAASFGAAGAGLTGGKMARRIGNIDEFEFKAVGTNHNQGRLSVGILVSGLAFEYEDFLRPWEGHNDNLERYAIQWESKNLIAVTTAVKDWLASRVAIELMKKGAMNTVVSTLVSALSLPSTLLTVTDIIDSRWAIALDRSDKAGKLLAEVLLQRMQGNRPVTLIGFSLGARVIFKCLQCFAETGVHAELIERVVLLGAPVSINDENWQDARKMVAGRFVNAYSTNDWTLGIAFRASLLSQGLAGIQPVEGLGIENVDVTHFIEGHSSYLWNTIKILQQLELESCCPIHKATF